MPDRELGTSAHDALASLLTFIQGSPAGGLPVGELVRLYRKAKQQQGRKTIADKLGIDEDGLVRLDRVVRSLGRELMSSTRSVAGHQTKTIAVLRFLGVLQTLTNPIHEFDRYTEIAPRGTAELARKQLRAVELLLRAMMREQYDSEERLAERLGQLFGQTALEEFTRRASAGDILTGLSFAELASFFIDRSEFTTLVERYFSAEQSLTFLGDKRASAFALLDDLAHIRDGMARARPLSATEINLVGVYYDELVEPLQQAFDRLSTRINPEQFLDASDEEIGRYISELRVEARGVQETIVSTPIDAAPDAPAPPAEEASPAADIDAEVAAMDRRIVDVARLTLAILVGVVGVHTFLLLARF